MAFGEDALTGTITRTSDSKAADLEHAAVADDPDATVNSPPEVKVSISVAGASVAEGSSATVTGDAERRPQADRRDPDHNDECGRHDPKTTTPACRRTVTFNNGETTKTFTFMAVDDTDADHGQYCRG